jgi:hypothetical protein
MNTRNIFKAGLSLLAIVLVLSTTRCTGITPQDGTDVPEAILKSSETNSILFLREEEKLARDVYQTLYEVFPLRPFLNISKSEQAHMDAILYLINLYGLEDPVGDNPVGVFENQELQELYDTLVEQGKTDAVEALRVGALIEEVDILDLRAALEQDPADEETIRVFTNLCRASGNHLRAFVRVLTTYGVQYEPVRLEDADFREILSE